MIGSGRNITPDITEYGVILESSEVYSDYVAYVRWLRRKGFVSHERLEVLSSDAHISTVFIRNGQTRLLDDTRDRHVGDRKYDRINDVKDLLGVDDVKF